MFIHWEHSHLEITGEICAAIYVFQTIRYIQPLLAFSTTTIYHTEYGQKFSLRPPQLNRGTPIVELRKYLNLSDWRSLWHICSIGRWIDFWSHT